MLSSLRIRRFEQLPSSADFESLIEAANVPAVFGGCVNDWKAVSKWNPSNNGLDYLQERVGSCVVEAMLSKSAPVFYGDLRSHERVPVPFSAFIGFCKERMQNADDGHGVNCEVGRHGVTEAESINDCWPYDDTQAQIYLAQVPILNIENEEHVQLETLREDIQTPVILEEKVISSLNLWMNNAQARSSTHYDPHHNLLCLVAGCKQVVLWPPSASPSLYPMPIHGEASNHSSIPLENPDFSVYPRAECLKEYSQKVVLHAGDALFIPEGWFHQNEALPKVSSAEMGKMKRNPCEPLDKRESDHITDDLNQTCETLDSKGTQQENKNMLHELDPFAIQVLHELVSLVHECVNVADHGEPVQSNSTNDSTVSLKVEYSKIVTADSFRLEDDPVAKILWTLKPCTLQNVFLAMARNFPRTLEALILHLLSPVGAEVLTCKFEEMDQEITEEDRNGFYQVFYSAFDDQFAAMDAILNGKESFSHQAFKNVLDKYLGVDLGGPRRGVIRFHYVPDHHHTQHRNTYNNRVGPINVSINEGHIRQSNRPSPPST
ncbi:hypothetical protein FNV43_RR23337 [Rhamnella rubrinervis]|uniref:JmjC domain-containing protein n=1 Tax=Rhamnella rubrinervis TaxID=2594499 RepID=A0A8K0DYQ5_9ROSA|nr:hypothetical protein FNV43_RR23337 [Rhamnella rubrinervis]